MTPVAILWRRLGSSAGREEDRSGRRIRRGRLRGWSTAPLFLPHAPRPPSDAHAAAQTGRGEPNRRPGDHARQALAVLTIGGLRPTTAP